MISPNNMHNACSAYLAGKSRCSHGHRQTPSCAPHPIKLLGRIVVWADTTPACISGDPLDPESDVYWRERNARV